jgi:hypothetical protein
MRARGPREPGVELGPAGVTRAAAPAGVEPEQADRDDGRGGFQGDAALLHDRAEPRQPVGGRHDDPGRKCRLPAGAELGGKVGRPERPSRVGYPVGVSGGGSQLRA